MSWVSIVYLIANYNSCSLAFSYLFEAGGFLWVSCGIGVSCSQTERLFFEVFSPVCDNLFEVFHTLPLRGGHRTCWRWNELSCVWVLSGFGFSECVIIAEVLGTNAHADVRRRRTSMPAANTKGLLET